MSETIFRTLPDRSGIGRGDIIECEIAGEIGRARIMSDGADEAKKRAEAQCRRKVAGAAIMESLRGHPV